MTTAVAFDYFGTLTPTVLDLRNEDEQTRMAAALGVDKAALDQEWNASFNERATGVIGDLPTTLELLARRVGGDPTPDGVAEAVRIRAASYLRTALPRPGTAQVLRELRRQGLGIAVVSDCSMELPDRWAELGLADLVDVPVFSAKLGVRKPDPRMYRAAVAGLGVKPEECLYVGDGGSGELTGAAKFGMRAILIADENWAKGHRYDSDKWDGEKIHEIEEVLTLV